tara:strand:- start:562 stop:777 length:216 start_codon:yes stop_codon:yes gene_type:complete
MSWEEQQKRENIAQVWTFALLSVCLSFMRTFYAFYYLVKASQNLHDLMTKNVLRARISFFDTNPMGRILNR